ncbi:MAG: 5-oxoprolinase subunit PxpB [Dokdonella sp.]|uniref:5-oxoprolinase subunit PxpB n=1 Tax=Dokdonella sp. TaxID=2291710 RepID=UPI0025BC8ADF|nr:5-oxoprolinase subunit PxpB [Dokdonella sp.]MBZ0221555.1 5-oxoprolinase subunit PxpB [Dokdonella sp.]
MSASAEPGFTIEPLGETTLLLRFGTQVDAAVNARVHAAAALLRKVEMPGLLDLIPAGASLALHYDAPFWAGSSGEPPWQHLAGTLRAVFATPPTASADSGRVVEVPVCYGGEFGCDLDAVASHAGIDAACAIARHCAGEYRVAMLGFAPGFPYLLGLDPTLHMPRRAQPRLRVPPGSVAIGGAQTGIYPRELPGGWHLIGRTPVSLFDVEARPPSLLAPGDRVRFRAIDAEEFEAIAEANAR